MDGTMKDSTVDLAQVRYDTSTGLVPVVVQDVASGNVLMVAYANREALKRTLATKQGWFWSRSRQEYWHKGATSGNVLHVQDVRMDCDGDSVLYLVRAAGPACHTGQESCFYRSVTHGVGQAPDEPREAQTVAAEEEKEALQASLSPVRTQAMPLPAGSFDTLVSLWRLLDERFQERPAGSYTTYLYTQGAEKIGKKVGEEGVEVALAALRKELTDQGETLAEESADLLYHLLALWRYSGLSPASVMKVLEQR
jgi:phosphoribosyl-AMP cyclohydrolase / phosphoribosyl-ATP pyrophosphohydrolase